MMMITIELYRDGWGYRWRLVTSGRIIADSAKAYDSAGNCQRAVAHLLKIKKMRWRVHELAIVEPRAVDVLAGDLEQ